MAEAYFTYLAPALMLAALFIVVVRRGRWWVRVPVFYRATATVAVALCSVMPFCSGLSAASLLLSISPSFSIGTVAVMLLFIVRNITKDRSNGTRAQGRVLDRATLGLFCLWNVIVGTALYSGTLGLLPHDLYFVGYTFSWVFILTAALTLVAIVTGSRLKWVFLAYVVAWNHALLPSPNFFDYIIDPVLFFISIGVLVSYARYSMKGCEKVAEGADLL
ncbi:MAG: hypothetical protein IME99_07720 [Proteobacteria bacterium]|nr:hypothetical protein [Pseudomonadota bacterium]